MACFSPAVRVPARRISRWRESMPEDREDRNEPKPGIARREFMKRGAIAAGTAMWAAPVVQSFTNTAFGQVRPGTPGCDCRFCAESAFGVIFVCTPRDPADCDCLCRCGGAD